MSAGPKRETKHDVVVFGFETNRNQTFIIPHSAISNKVCGSVGSGLVLAKVLT